MEIEQYLAQHPLFQGFSEESLRELARAAEVKVYAPEEVIIPFGQPGRHLGIIAEGEAEARAEDGSLLGRIPAGEVIGEMSLLTGEPTSADVVAVEECRAILIPHDVMSMRLAANPQVMQRIARTIAARLRKRESDEGEMVRLQRAWLQSRGPADLKTETGSRPMKVLAVNCGSSSLKYDFFDSADERTNASGRIERIGEEKPVHEYRSLRGNFTRTIDPVDHAGALARAVRALTDPERGVIRDLNGLDAVGHRVVHGGEKYSHPVLVDDAVIEQIRQMVTLAPLHNPVNLLGIEEARKLLPAVPQVAVFDTAFHQTMPQAAYVYALPYACYQRDRIRRYGFHGTSHHYVALQAAGFLNRPFRELKLITCHLGNGASVCAIEHGRSVDTSMGMTPLEGLVMGTRCGDLDPALIPYLMQKQRLSSSEIDSLLNRESGLKGLSGISNDIREIEAAADQGDQRALLALQVFCYRVKKYIGAYVAALGGLDALVFTAGIGEKDPAVRARVCQGMSHMGLIIDEMKNRDPHLGLEGVVDVSDERSRVRILVIHTDEQRMIARETIRALGHRNVEEIIRQKASRPIPIGVSARHAHLSREHVEALFGPGHQLTPRANLSQPGQFACEETINLIGPKNRIDRVRVLGPERPQTQVEIARTEEFRLGIDAPIRASGDIEGSLGIVLEGPERKIAIEQGVICSLRHIHMNPEDALGFGLHDRDMVMVRVSGERPLILGDTLVRVNPNFHRRGQCRRGQHRDGRYHRIDPGETVEAGGAGILCCLRPIIHAVNRFRQAEARGPCLGRSRCPIMITTSQRR